MRDPPLITSDAGASFFCTGTNGSNTLLPPTGSNTLQEYQYRIGAHYYPASPVQNSIGFGGSICNGGSESWNELSKILNLKTLSSASVLKWAIPPYSFNSANINPIFSTLPEFDYRDSFVRWQNGSPVVLRIETFSGVGNGALLGNSFCGNVPSSCFAMAVNLESFSSKEISGIDCSDQTNISFLCRWNIAQSTSMVFHTFTNIDVMLVIHDNSIELIK